MDGVLIPSDLFKKLKKALKDPELEKALSKAKSIDVSQAWFWTKEWQEGERKADDDIKAGRVKEIKSPQDLDKPITKVFK